MLVGEGQPYYLDFLRLDLLKDVWNMLPFVPVPEAVTLNEARPTHIIRCFCHIDSKPFQLSFNSSSPAGFLAFIGIMARPVRLPAFLGRRCINSHRTGEFVRVFL